MAPEQALEIWTSLTGGVLRGSPETVARWATTIERDGWDGASVVDSQNLFADVYVCLTLVATATTRLKLGPGVGNPITRHPAVNACAMASLQQITGGRMVYGIGRGDSALAFIGASPAAIDAFEDYLRMLQTYLRGDSIPLEAAVPTVRGTAPGFDKLAISEIPDGSRIRWLDPGQKKVPLEVAATGPRVMGVGARVAERVTFAVGAKPERVRWAIDTTRRACEAAGRDPAELSLGMYVSCVPFPDKAVALKLQRGAVASQVRFSVMNKKIVGPVSPREREMMETLAHAYDMNRHSLEGRQSEVLDDDIIDSFSVVGPVGECVERLQELIGLGLDRVCLFNASQAGPQGMESYQQLVAEVLPALRS